ncbi:MAG: hypothetical protein JNM56_36880 [Planctomycetia bacterium]|nr:hypothetical protein [Planctomycetia bacterium]
MKQLLTLSCAGLLAVLVGCEQGKPGGPGATNNTSSERRIGIGPAENTFQLDMPNLSTKVKQGETKIIGIGIKRGKNFDQDVTLKFDKVPQGVTIDAGDAAIQRGAEEAKVTVKVAEDAALGDFTIGVNGIPKDGASAVNEFKITVEQK